MKNVNQTESELKNPDVNIRIVLASLWIGHFLLWTFGDMFALLQETTVPVTEPIFLLIAPITAIMQALMIVSSLKGGPKYVRWANIVVSIVFLVFNIGYLADSSEFWNYLLGSAYIVFNLLTVWHAWKWPRNQSNS